MEKPICLVSENLWDDAKVALESGFCVFSLPSDREIAPPVSAHPDMLLCKIGDRLILPRSYYEANKALINQIAELADCRIVLSSAERGSIYPKDVGMNVAVGKNFIICRTESTAAEIIDAANELGIKIIPVKQGYAGCSCIVCENAVLTSDIGIHRTLTSEGIDSTYVDKSGISLPGYDVGFIGGCGGFYNGVLYFFGSLDSVRCGSKVREFAKSHGFKVRELADGKLTDYGGVKFFD